MKNKILNSSYFFILVLLTLFFQSCNTDDDNNIEDNSSIEDDGGIVNNYIETIIPSDVTDLYEATGPESSDAIIVYAQGGPTSKLYTEDIEETQFNSYYRVYVKQSQHINTTINTNEITFEQAITEVNISTEIYHTVLKHFKDKGKTVIAMSHSLGSFILPNVIATKPNIADKVVLMAGRLDMPKVVWNGFRDGDVYDFPDGINPKASNKPTLTGGDLSITRLQAALGKNRYTKLLAEKDLKNVIYVYGEKDEAVGSLTNQEILFLKSKNVVPIAIANGNHSSMFQPNILNDILNEIQK